MDEKITEVVSDILGNATDSLVQPVSTQTLDDITFHDFGKYEFLLNPSDYKKIDKAPLSSAAVEYINDLEGSGASFETLEYMADLLTRLEANVKRAFVNGLGVTTVQQAQKASLKPTISALTRQVLHPLYSLHRRLIRQMVDFDRLIPDFFNVHLYGFLKKNAKGILDHFTPDEMILFDDSIAGENKKAYKKPPFDWVFVMLYFENIVFKDLNIEDTNLVSDLEYPFEIYPSGSVNVGVALVYRQRWKAIGSQPGDIIKTIPLGPGQSEKVMTKISRRKKMTSNMETSSESETTSESSDTTKDSTEVVNEASNQQNWSLSASAQYGIGGIGFGASASGEAGGSKAKTSKNTSSSLSEIMKKTASKIRRQTKVSITTEVESGFEETTTSEVMNKNDEVALTLQYHMLQHQYDIYTYLFSVRNVIFVAEKIPVPYEVNVSWVRRYDWIIAEELLDESFRRTINELIQDEDTEELINFNSQNPYSKMLETATEKFAGFDAPGNGNGLGGLDVSDIYAEPQRQYDQYRKGEEARRRANTIRDIQRTRLFNHIRDNILHYCRAIWAREDNEQRMLRYKKEGRTVPFIWQGPFIQDDATQFQPTEVRVAVNEIISDITPIGFTGNYIVFGLATSDYDSEDLVELNVDTPEGEVKLPLQEVLDIVRSAYTDGANLRDPALDYFIDEAEEILANTPNALATLPDETVFDLISFLPRLSEKLVEENDIIRNADKTLKYDISAEEWGEYLFKQNATRRFLVDSNNLYVSLLLGNGVALEPFKRVHRFIDVLKADEERKSEILKNERRALLKNTPNNFDPDISKVVIAAGSKTEDLVGGLLDGEDT